MIEPVSPAPGRRARRAAQLAVFALAVAALPATPAAAGPLPLGTLATTAAVDKSCPSGYGCQGIEVHCPAVRKDARGFVATGPRPAAPRGLVVFLNAGSGKRYWTETHDTARALVAELVDRGLRVVMVRWQTPWAVALSGERAGASALGCRPATALSWIRAHRYPVPGMAPNEKVGRCGFCVVGSSSGTNQAAYPLSHYGLDASIDAAVLTSGPTLGALEKGCLDTPGYRYQGSYETDVDRAYGYIDSAGPCRRSEPAYQGIDWPARWRADGVATGGSDYRHDTTRVHIIVGENDVNIPNHAADYRDRLLAAGSPQVCFQVIPDMGHGIKGSPEGMRALRDALLGTACPA
ncbi:MAG TPA: hypothetical protein VEO00_05680 [Actinomycetota bacterium]|nr:hypothetical protein [Actinomycetota bacterium]